MPSQPVDVPCTGCMHDTSSASCCVSDTCLWCSPHARIQWEVPTLLALRENIFCDKPQKHRMCILTLSLMTLAHDIQHFFLLQRAEWWMSFAYLNCQIEAGSWRHGSKPCNRQAGGSSAGGCIPKQDSRSTGVRQGRGRPVAPAYGLGARTQASLRDCIVQ